MMEKCNILSERGHELLHQMLKLQQRADERGQRREVEIAKTVSNLPAAGQSPGSTICQRLEPALSSLVRRRQMYWRQISFQKMAKHCECILVVVLEHSVSSSVCYIDHFANSGRTEWRTKLNSSIAIERNQDICCNVICWGRD